MTSFLRRLCFAVAAALAVAPLAVSPLPAAAAETLAVVPFAVPGSEKIQNLDDATGILTAKLTEKGITPKTLPPTDRLGVVASAAQICAQTGADGILVPTARTEQGERKKNYVLVTVPYFATHVELRLARLRCDGTLAWSFVTFGDKDYYSSNVQAAVADGITQATGRAIDAYVARPADAAPAASPAPAVSSAVSLTTVSVVAQAGQTVAIVPFTQAGSQPDPSLDFATEEARQRFVARGFKAVVTDPADHLVATKDAPALCARYGATQLEMGTLRWEQTARFAGLRTHAEVMLTTVDCTGKVVASQDLVGEHLHNGANFRAGVSSAIEDAFGHWAQMPLPGAKT
ncbi:MAG TPA: hypothetical protein VGT98_07405 [Candidatus Elarobacter sp.]|nr:hypothetical protein [Candidatus Elarobacter sp.]HEV2741031.1 hypothetical protein [Candidatus Elarobacter sp.]